jgi:hypothetical protein
MVLTDCWRRRFIFITALKYNRVIVQIALNPALQYIKQYPSLAIVTFVTSGGINLKHIPIIEQPADSFRYY